MLFAVAAVMYGAPPLVVGPIAPRTNNLIGRGVVLLFTVFLFYAR